MFLVVVALMLWALSAYLVYSALTSKPPNGDAQSSVGDGDLTVAAVSGRGSAPAEKGDGLGALKTDFPDKNL